MYKYAWYQLLNYLVYNLPNVKFLEKKIDVENISIIILLVN